MTAWNDSPPPSYYEAPDPPGETEETGPEWCSYCGRPKIESTVFVGCACPEDDDER